MAVISVTAANVSVSSPLAQKLGTAGATITAGQAVYKDATDSDKIKLADADAQATAACVGVSLNGASSGQPVSYAAAGSYNPGATVAAGVIYCVSSTAGGIWTATQVVSGDYMTVIGVGTAANAILIDLNVSTVALA